LYRVPNAHRVEGARPTAVTLYDGHGKTLAREDVQGIPASIRSLNQHRIEGYPLLSVPAEAIWKERRQLFDLRADDGDRIGLWLANRRENTDAAGPYPCAKPKSLGYGVSMCP